MVTKVMKLEMPTLQEVLKNSGGSEDVLEELLCKFRLWLKQQIHLPQDVSDQRLKLFISTVKFDYEKAKEKLDLLYTLHSLLPEMYDNFDPLSEDIKGQTFFQFTPLPKLTPEKYRVHVFRLIDYDDTKFNLLVIMRYFLMSGEVRLEEDIVTENVLIWDCTGININHAMKYTPVLLKKIDTCLKAYGLRIKAIHLINAPVVIDMVMKVAKIVMAAKLFNRIQVYTSGIESLYGIIPKSILPVDYGGEQPSMDTLTDMWFSKLVEQRDLLLKEGECKSNESLRTNSVKNPQDMFGVSGTFRQLQID